MEGAKGVQGASSLHLPDSKRCFRDLAVILLLEMSLGSESLKRIPEQWGIRALARWCLVTTVSPSAAWSWSWQRSFLQHRSPRWALTCVPIYIPPENFLRVPNTCFSCLFSASFECPVPVPWDFNFFRFLWLLPALSQKLNLVRGKYSVSTCRMCARVSEGSPSFRVIAIWMSRRRILCEVNGVIVVFYYIVLHSVSLLILSKTIP